QRNDVSMINELERYLALPLAPEGNPLKWWYKFEKEFPTLCKMAKNYLSIQRTSVPSEHAFSIAAHTIMKIRSNLAPGSVRAVMCLKSWMTKVRDDYYDYDEL
ncbi:14385_t:CDS:1, partial [Ambispora leptoticha]